MRASDFRNAVQATYEYAHNNCHYAPTDQSFPVGSDGKIDCTGLVLRSLWMLGYVNRPLNCDEMDALMPQFGFIKSTDVNDIFRHSVCVVQWVLPQWVGSNHVHHTYVAIGGNSDGTINKFDTGSDARIQSYQPYTHVQIDEWGGKYRLKCIWYLDEEEEKKEEVSDGVYINISRSENSMGKLFKLKEIGKGDKGVETLLLQEILKARGFYSGGLDRIFGSKTEQAVKEFQQKRIDAGAKLGKADGICGEKTWKDILGLPQGDNSKTLKIKQIAIGDKGTDVLLLQEILMARGLYTGGLDRAFGNLTKTALVKFQQLRIDAGADIGGADGKPDGICGVGTWADLLALPKA